MNAESQKESAFSVEAGVLKVNKELDEISAEELLEAIRGLGTSGVEAPVLDLADISFLPSYHISGIRTAGDELIHKGRALTVFARRNVKTLLERMGLSAAVRLKSVD